VARVEGGRGGGAMPAMLRASKQVRELKTGVVLAKASTHNHRSELLRRRVPHHASTTLTGVMDPGIRQDDGAASLHRVAKPPAQRSNP